MSQSSGVSRRRVLHMGTPLFNAPSGRSAKIAYLLAGAVVDVTGDARRGFLSVSTVSGASGYVRSTALSENLAS